MAVHSFSDEQVDKARHALGLTRGKTAYRNHYVVDGTDPDWEDLVTRGFAGKFKYPLAENYTCYNLTKRGAFCFINTDENMGDIAFAQEPKEEG